MINPIMRKITILLAVCSITVCTWFTTAGAEESKEITSKKAAMVNGKIISIADFERELQLYQNHYRSKSPNLPPDFLNQLRVQVINEMINQELLYQDSQKQKIAIGKEALNKQFADFQRQFPTENHYREWLTNMQFTEEALKIQFARRMTVGALVEQEIISKINISDEEARAFFEKNPNKFRKDERVRASHILISVDKTADADTKAKARQTLNDIKKKILAGDDFAALAKAHSQGPSSANGGDLGMFKRGQMVKPFDEVAFKLAVNEVSDIVETKYGYHLIKVFERKSAENPSFNEAKKSVVKTMSDMRFNKQIAAYIGKLRKNAKIETFVN